MDENAIEETTEETPANPADFVKLLEDLVPADLIIFDLEGNKYKLPSKLSARRQIKALRMVEMAATLLQDINVEDDAFASMETMMRAAMGVLSDERLLDIIDETFETCYPGISKGIEGPPSDNFDIEELVKAFGPLAVAFAKTMVKAGNLLS
jgi:hypothetical protein